MDDEDAKVIQFYIQIKENDPVVEMSENEALFSELFRFESECYICI